MAHLLLAIKMTVFFSVDGNNKNEIKKERYHEGNMVNRDEPR